jgi:hypothetical protein
MRPGPDHTRFTIGVHAELGQPLFELRELAPAASASMVANAALMPPAANVVDDHDSSRSPLRITDHELPRVRSPAASFMLSAWTSMKQ